MTRDPVATKGRDNRKDPLGVEEPEKDKDKDVIKKDLSACLDDTREAPIKKLQSILFGARPATPCLLETEIPKQENFQNI